MTVAAIQPQPGNVVLMAERDRLLKRDVLPGNVGRALQLEQRCRHPRQQEDDSQYAGASQSICTAVKKLWHGSYTGQHFTAALLKRLLGRRPPASS